MHWAIFSFFVTKRTQRPQTARKWLKPKPQRRNKDRCPFENCDVPLKVVVSLNSIQCKLTLTNLLKGVGAANHTPSSWQPFDDRVIIRYSGYLITFIWKHIRNRKDHCHGSFAHHYILSSSQSCHLQQVSEIKRPLFLVTHTSSLLAHTSSILATLAMSIYVLAHMPSALSQLPENAACYNISRHCSHLTVKATTTL